MENSTFSVVYTTITSTNDCDTIVIDTINHVDNVYAFAEAVVVGINPLMLQTVVPLGVVATVWE